MADNKDKKQGALEEQAEVKAAEQTTAEQSVTELTTAEQAVTEPTTAEQAVTEPTAEQAVTEQATAEQAPAEQTEVVQATSASKKAEDAVDDPRLTNAKKVKQKTPEQLEKEAAAQKAKLERYMEKRKVYIKKKTEALDKHTEKERQKIKTLSEKSINKSDDDSEKKDIEYYTKKRLESLEREYESKRRVLQSSTGRSLSYEKKKRLYGYGFIALWMVGALYMFIGPLIQSVNYSLHNTTLVSSAEDLETYGMDSAGIHLEWNNFDNYRRAFLVDRDYVVTLGESLVQLAPQVLLILVLSLFIALLINQKFKGRTLMRAIFFLPVLIATGPIISVINGDIAAQGAGGNAAQFSTLFKTDLVDGFMNFLGLYNLDETLTSFISDTTSDIFNLIWMSGIQILIFLSALQQIPTAAKEAASMEGATGWEFFWKITFPTISPMILANLIYTIIDTFSDHKNPVMAQVMAQIRSIQYGYSAAIAWIYFAIIALALGIIVAIVSRFVFYQVD